MLSNSFTCSVSALWHVASRHGRCSKMTKTSEFVGQFNLIKIAVRQRVRKRPQLKLEICNYIFLKYSDLTILIKFCYRERMSSEIHLLSPTSNIAK